jgi:hypothetical protein
MATVITDNGVVGENSASSNSVTVTLTADVPHGTIDDPNYLAAVIAYEGDLGPLDGSSQYNDGAYIVGWNDSGTNDDDPYFGQVNHAIYQPNRWSLRSPTGNLGIITPSLYIILQDLVTGDTVDVTLTRAYGSPQPTWIDVRLHSFTGFHGYDPIAFFSTHGGVGAGPTWAWITFPTTTSPESSGGITFDQDVFKYRSAIHEPDEAVTWIQPHPSLPEQHHFSRSGYRASYRFDQPEPTGTITTASVSFPSSGSHIIYNGEAAFEPGEGLSYTFSPPPDPATLPGKLGYYKDGQWNLIPDYA